MGLVALTLNIVIAVVGAILVLPASLRTTAVVDRLPTATYRPIAGARA